MLISQSVIYLISLKKSKQPWLNLNDSCKSQTRALTELMKSNAIQCITLATLIIAIKKKHMNQFNQWMTWLWPWLKYALEGILVTYQARRNKRINKEFLNFWCKKTGKFFFDFLFLKMFFPIIWSVLQNSPFSQSPQHLSNIWYSAVASKQYSVDSSKREKAILVCPIWMRPHLW